MSNDSHTDEILFTYYSTLPQKSTIGQFLNIPHTDKMFIIPILEYGVDRVQAGYSSRGSYESSFKSFFHLPGTTVTVS